MPSQFEEDCALVNTSASDSAASFIRGMIFSGELTAGTKLPAGSDLASRLRVSIVTLRIALKQLETAGYIVTTTGAHGGSRVNDAPGLRTCWQHWLVENADDIDEMFELRTAIEAEIARFAAERRTEENLAEMEAAGELLRGANRTVPPWNAAFHGALARAAHSRQLARAMRDVQSNLFLPVEADNYEHQVDELLADHLKILDAVRTHNAPLAAECMRSHLADTLNLFRRSLERVKAGDGR